jgi:hypothetical protein
VREGTVAPSAAQEQMADALGSDATSWNEFGTPRVLMRHGGYLTGARGGEAVDVARSFVREHSELFKMAPIDADSLEVLRDSPLYDSPDLGRGVPGGCRPRTPTSRTWCSSSSASASSRPAWTGCSPWACSPTTGASLGSTRR